MSSWYTEGASMDLSSIAGTGNTRAMLLTASYTFDADHGIADLAGHECSGGTYTRVDLSDVSTSTAIVGQIRLMSGATAVEFGRPAGGDPAYLVVYRVSDSDLIACFEVSDDGISDPIEYAWDSQVIAIRFASVQTSTGIPAGGSAGYVLTKVSGADYHVQWTQVPIIPDYSGADNGDVLGLDGGAPTWLAPSSGLPDYSGASEDDVLTIDGSGDPMWAPAAGGGLDATGIAANRVPLSDGADAWTWASLPPAGNADVEIFDFTSETPSGGPPLQIDVSIASMPTAKSTAIVLLPKADPDSYTAYITAPPGDDRGPMGLIIMVEPGSVAPVLAQMVDTDLNIFTSWNIFEGPGGVPLVSTTLIPGQDNRLAGTFDAWLYQAILNIFAPPTGAGAIDGGTLSIPAASTTVTVDDDITDVAGDSWDAKATATLFLVQGSIGGEWNNGLIGAVWAGGTPPVLSTTEGNVDVIRLTAMSGGGLFGEILASDITP